VTSSARVVEMCAAVPERVLEEQEVGRSRGGGHAWGAGVDMAALGLSPPAR
jgi:hypothetical protein